MINYKNIIFDEFDSDIWHTLKNSNLPILIYGMGNGADKIISVFEKYQILLQKSSAMLCFFLFSFFYGFTSFIFYVITFFIK